MEKQFNPHETQLNSTWLNGKYKNGEINTAIPYLSYGGFFVQGDDANVFIAEIYKIWTTEDLTTEQAFEKWAFRNGLE